MESLVGVIGRGKGKRGVDAVAGRPTAVRLESQENPGISAVGEFIVAFCEVVRDIDPDGPGGRIVVEQNLSALDRRLVTARGKLPGGPGVPFSERPRLVGIASVLSISMSSTRTLLSKVSV